MYELKDYTNAINYTKEPLLDNEDEEWTKKYPPFIVNKCLAPFPDTILLVNEINQLHHLDKKLQFDFLLNSLRTRKRYAPWLKAKKLKNLEYVKEYYGYNNEKAKLALDLLDDEQISAIKRKLYKGGKNGRS
ncbi:MAG: DNA polymerase [Thaumarchaeota archaeon]|nr:DNA polymerase [Nitrososphaerota archaeon]